MPCHKRRVRFKVPRQTGETRFERVCPECGQPWTYVVEVTVHGPDEAGLGLVLREGTLKENAGDKELRRQDGWLGAFDPWQMREREQEWRERKRRGQEP